MTDPLTTLLRERADAAPAPDLDPGLVLRAGRRRVRAARLRTGATALAVAGVCTVGVLAGSGLFPAADLPGQPAAQPAGQPGAAERQVGYARGQSIHSGDRTITVAARVASYVQTDDGFVYATPGGQVRVTDGTDEQRIGRTADLRLRADDTGSLVAWLTPGSGATRSVTVYDTASRTRVADLPVADGAAPDRDPLLGAVDEGSVYWLGGAGVERYDVASGTSTTLGPDPQGAGSGGPTDLVDVANGVLAWTVSGPDGTRLVVGRDLGRGGTELPAANRGALSRDGALVGLEDSGDLRVYRTGSGADATPDLSRYPYATLFGWVDDHTAMVFALTDVDADPSPAELLTCDVGTGACQVAVERLRVDGDEAESFVLPTGDPMT